MPYDKSLDKELFKEVKEFESSRISVGVYSYNNNEKKIQISREDKDQNGDWRFAKLGRMTKPELTEILPVLGKAIGAM